MRIVLLSDRIVNSSVSNGSHVMPLLQCGAISTGAERGVGKGKYSVESRVETKIVGDVLYRRVPQTAGDNAQLVPYLLGTRRFLFEPSIFNVGF